MLQSANCNASVHCSHLKVSRHSLLIRTTLCYTKYEVCALLSPPHYFEGSHRASPVLHRARAFLSVRLRHEVRAWLNV
eukprot:6186684-Pleurochrysis_carterae.AAC.2